MKKTMKILGGSLLVALMSISLATKLNVREVKHLEVRDLLTEDMTKPVTGRVVRKAANEEAANKISAVKAQIADTAEGKRHIRFVVGLDSVNYADAKFNIVAKDGDNVVKTFADQPVTTAYTHIEAAGVVQSAAQAFGAGYNYLMAFTIKNVPESAWNYSFEVTSSVRTEEAAEWTTTKVAKKVITEIAAADEEISAPIFNLSGIVDGGEGDAYLEANAGKNFVRYIEGVYTGYHLDETTKDLSIGIENPNSNGIWYGYQLFAVPTGIEIGAEYHISFTLNSSVAGRIQVHQKVYNIEVGDNLIEYSAVYTGGTGVNTAPFSLIFAAYDSTNEEVLVMQNANYVIKGFTMTKVVVETPDVPEGDETRNFVTMNTMFGEEPLAGNADNVGRHILYWNDQDWCGSIVNVTASVENEVATYEVASNNGGCWYGFQLFATPTERVSVVSFTLNSSVAGKIKVNGTYVDIVVGDNEISMPAFTQTAGLSIQFGEDGNQANNAIVQNATYKVSNLVFGVNTPVTPDPEPEEPDTPVIPEPGEAKTLEVDHVECYGDWFMKVFLKYDGFTFEDINRSTIVVSMSNNSAPSTGEQVGYAGNFFIRIDANERGAENKTTGTSFVATVAFELNDGTPCSAEFKVHNGAVVDEFPTPEPEQPEPEEPEVPDTPVVPGETKTIEINRIECYADWFMKVFLKYDGFAFADINASTIKVTMSNNSAATVGEKVGYGGEFMIRFDANERGNENKTVGTAYVATIEFELNDGTKYVAEFNVSKGAIVDELPTPEQPGEEPEVPDAPIELPAKPEGALDLVLGGNWNPHGDGFLVFGWTNAGLTNDIIAEYKVTAIIDGVESAFTFNRIDGAVHAFFRNTDLGTGIGGASYILVVEFTTTDGTVYFAAVNVVNGSRA